MQVRAALAIAEAALDQDAAGQPTVYTVADVACIAGCSEETSGGASTPGSWTL